MAQATFNPQTKRWATDGAGNRPEGLRGSLECDDATLDTYSVDFGKVIQARPGAVLHAETGEDVARALAFCNEYGIRAVARGFGQSGNGESLGEGALVIDTRKIAQIDEIGPDRITVGAGITWRQLVVESMKFGVSPPVFTNHIDVSVGGSTTIGGLGVTSHRFGFQVDNIVELEVATLDGKLRRCSDRENTALFHAVRGGFGQYGFVTRVTMRSIPAPERVAMVRIHYDDIETMLDDTFELAQRNRIDSIDNLTRMPRPPEEGVIYNDVGFFLYDGGEIPNLARAIGKVRGKPEPRETIDYLSFLRLQEFYVGFISSVPLSKPWVALLLPQSKLAAFVDAHVKPVLDFTEQGTIAMFVQPYRMLSARNSLPFPSSDEEWFGVLGLIRIRPPPAVPGALAEHRHLVKAALSVGGTIYPYGTIPVDPKEWSAIFGSRWPEIVARKRAYDPDGLLNSSFGIGVATLDG